MQQVNANHFTGTMADDMMMARKAFGKFMRDEWKNAKAMAVLVFSFLCSNIHVMKKEGVG